jgi:glycosyltransferase involved in cell wall biosynthesis
VISIVLPNLNTPLRFLRERLDSITGQTFKDWECVVVDGYSDNGSFEMLDEAARADQRFRMYQRPRKGIYNAWNEGINLSTGDMIYIATSDDTMTMDCLQKMVSALRSHPDCGVAHCNLTIIDEASRPIEKNKWSSYPSPAFFGNLMDVDHVRIAPHDGLLHAFIKTVYQSVTQLLVKREVFDAVGLFLENAGSIADYEWDMRASFHFNVVHIPLYLATWRIHKDQATTRKIHYEPKMYQQLINWVKADYLYWQEKSGAGLKYNIDELLQIYRHNKRYYTLKKYFGIPFLEKAMSRLFPDFRYRSGVVEAKDYFSRTNTSSLIRLTTTSDSK